MLDFSTATILTPSSQCMLEKQDMQRVKLVVAANLPSVQRTASHQSSWPSDVSPDSHDPSNS